MAKSIYEILADLTTETSVPGFGTEVQHTIPRNLFPTPEVFESGEQLLTWANEAGYTHALLQMGLQKGLIDVRAKFKSCKKNDQWTVSYGQANVDSHKWEITERPNQGASKKVNEAVLAVGIKMAKAMLTANQPDNIIIAALSAVYGDVAAKEILNSAKK